MTLTDVALDILNIFVFHAGMFGMGLASSVSYYVVLAISGVYFFRDGCLRGGRGVCSMFIPQIADNAVDIFMDAMAEVFLFFYMGSCQRFQIDIFFRRLISVQYFLSCDIHYSIQSIKLHSGNTGNAYFQVFFAYNRMSVPS